jgi:hypothetical protein
MNPGGTGLNAESYRKETLFEHRFWLQILGDHSRFILNSLSPLEKEEIQKASYFMQLFDKLLDRARQSTPNQQLNEMTMEAYKSAQEIREFKLHLLRRHLTGEIRIKLPPTFLNHMLNELEEYLTILNFIISKNIPIANPVHHHLLWLLDASGHAYAVETSLDDVERKLEKKSNEFRISFDALYLKALEMPGYFRTKQTDFPALSRLNKEAEQEMMAFVAFLENIGEMKLKKELLGTVSPLMIDHMLREECYYLTKLSMSSDDIAVPNCDPTRPRIKE